MKIASYLNNGGTLSEQGHLNADMNKDGKVTNDDLEMLETLVYGTEA